ncbi:unnamed protein product [Owenia fusiformis]|uniref:Uncharacterized protein n=1 Tax=Owenia fusiformis TaxID=6347 RepID=A0A8J1U4E3_OWEFU|nr:unnamed protein product [Owenia fusiformis]
MEPRDPSQHVSTRRDECQKDDNDDPADYDHRREDEIVENNDLIGTEHSVEQSSINDNMLSEHKEFEHIDLPYCNDQPPKAHLNDSIAAQKHKDNVVTAKHSTHHNPKSAYYEQGHDGLKKKGVCHDQDVYLEEHDKRREVEKIDPAIAIKDALKEACLDHIPHKRLLEIEGFITIRSDEGQEVRLHLNETIRNSTKLSDDTKRIKSRVSDPFPILHPESHSAERASQDISIYKRRMYDFGARSRSNSPYNRTEAHTQVTKQKHKHRSFEYNNERTQINDVNESDYVRDSPQDDTSVIREAYINEHTQNNSHISVGNDGTENDESNIENVSHLSNESERNSRLDRIAHQLWKRNMEGADGSFHDDQDDAAPPGEQIENSDPNIDIIKLQQLAEKAVSEGLKTFHQEMIQRSNPPLTNESDSMYNTDKLHNSTHPSTNRSLHNYNQTNSSSNLMTSNNFVRKEQIGSHDPQTYRTNEDDKTGKNKARRTCEICGRSFSFQTNLTRHMKNVHKKPSYRMDLSDPLETSVVNISSPNTSGSLFSSASVSLPFSDSSNITDNLSGNMAPTNKESDGNNKTNSTVENTPIKMEVLDDSSDSLSKENDPRKENENDSRGRIEQSQPRPTNVQVPLYPHLFNTLPQDLYADRRLYQPLRRSLNLVPGVNQHETPPPHHFRSQSDSLIQASSAVNIHFPRLVTSSENSPVAVENSTNAASNGNFPEELFIPEKHPTLGWVCKICGMSFSFQTNLTRHHRNQHRKPPTRRSRSGGNSRSLERLPLHDSSPNTIPSRPHSESRLHSEKSSYSEHYTDHHERERYEDRSKTSDKRTEGNDKEVPSSQGGQNNTEKANCCKICYKTFGSKVLLHQHIKTHKSTIRCGHCQKTFKSAYDLKIHKYRLHASSGPRIHNSRNGKTGAGKPEAVSNKASSGESTIPDQFNCKLCSMDCKTNNALLRHMKLRHPEPRHKCEDCNKSFGIRYLLKSHQAKHHKKQHTNATGHNSGVSTNIVGQNSVVSTYTGGQNYGVSTYTGGQNSGVSTYTPGQNSQRNEADSSSKAGILEVECQLCRVVFSSHADLYWHIKDLHEVQPSISHNEQSSMRQKHNAQPGIGQKHNAQPGMGQKHNAQPGMGQKHNAQPGMGQKHNAQPNPRIIQSQSVYSNPSQPQNFEPLNGQSCHVQSTMGQPLNIQTQDQVTFQEKSHMPQISKGQTHNVQTINMILHEGHLHEHNKQLHTKQRNNHEEQPLINEQTQSMQPQSTQAQSHSTQHILGQTESQPSHYISQQETKDTESKNDTPIKFTKNVDRSGHFSIESPLLGEFTSPISSSTPDPSKFVPVKYRHLNTARGVYNVHLSKGSENLGLDTPKGTKHLPVSQHKFVNEKDS